MGFIEGLGSTIGSVATGVARGAPSIGRVSVAAPVFSGPMIKIGGAAESFRPIASIKTGGSLRGFQSVTRPFNAPNNGGEFKPIFDFKPVAPKKVGFLEGFQKVAKPAEAPTLGGVFKFKELSDLGFKPARPVNKVVAVPIERVKPRIGVVEPVINPTIRPAVVPSRIEAPKPKIKTVVRPSWEPIIKPQEKPKEQAIVQAVSRPKTEAQTGSQTTQRVFTKPTSREQEEEVEQVVQEKVKQEAEDQLGEEQEIQKDQYLLDEQALAERKSEIRQAVIKARTEANRLGLKKIAGWLVARFLPAEHEGVRSEIVKRTGPDGSYQETMEAVASAGDFESEDGAVKIFNEVAEEKRPVKIGKEGKRVGLQDVARVFRYRFVKAVQPIELIVNRIVKKRTKAGQKQIITEPVRLKTPSGPTMESLGLAEVFSKAA